MHLYGITNDDEEHQQELDPLYLAESIEIIWEQRHQRNQHNFEDLKKEQRGQKLEFKNYEVHQGSETLQEDKFSIVMVSKHWDCY